MPPQEAPESASGSVRKPAWGGPRDPLTLAVRRWRAPAERRAASVCIAEGPHLVEEALQVGLPLVAAVATHHFVARPAADALLTRLQAAPRSGAGLPPGYPAVSLVAERAFAALSALPAPQGLLAVFRLPDQPAASACPACTLALDGVQDPGNVGALARALLAFSGADALLLGGPGSADPFGEKALRASAGAVLRLRYSFSADLPADLARMAAAGVQWWALCPREGTPLPAAELTVPLGLVVGGEGLGVSPAVLTVCRRLVVPMPGPAESLNAALAGGVVLYEAAMRANERRRACP